MSNISDVETYEMLYGQLQAVVNRLEQGDLPLAEALMLYEQGTRLAAACQKLLDHAEMRVQELRSDEVYPDLDLEA
ncbi:exodeoxyribonuclease VII small subunit [Candidatus Chloroploca sp. M-50]|uniref:Exodeoxyribonuclease 7 small subunit n=1 Tax=Candidatus Chloroploca mongolica TaxID=2528176 RepID=A0ABS4D7L7_9CHLR|nr:exodeoxyribonuclease VII small subunit [Candidatus Chloroploca mongolica]MBP1465433.1 exodeoxyribonuclease VII small subunit [Candidatus Chloroploca mongolica]